MFCPFSSSLHQHTKWRFESPNTILHFSPLFNFSLLLDVLITLKVFLRYLQLIIKAELFLLTALNRNVTSHISLTCLISMSDLSYRCLCFFPWPASSVFTIPKISSVTKQQLLLPRVSQTFLNTESVFPAAVHRLWRFLFLVKYHYCLFLDWSLPHAFIRAEAFPHPYFRFYPFFSLLSYNTNNQSQMR